MAVELNNRTKILAGVVVLAAAGAGAWFFVFQDDAPPPRTVVATPASAPKPGADAPKTADAAKAGEAPKAADAAKSVDAAKPSAAKPAAASPAKPIPTNPDQLIAEVIEASGVKAYFQVIAREAALNALWGDQSAPPVSGADIAAAAGAAERLFEPAKMSAEIAPSLKNGLEAERMARFLELLRQPVAVKIATQDMGKLTPEAARGIVDGNRKTPPPAARVKLVQSLDEVARSSEIGADMANAMARTMVDAMLDSMQKGAKSGVQRDARRAVSAQLNAIRSQARGQIRSTLLVLYGDASDEELGAYLKLLDTDTGRWGMDRLAEAMRPALVSRGGALGRELAPLAMARRGPVAKTPAEPSPEAPSKAQTEQPVEKPAATVAAAPAEPVGYRRPANIREVYTRYNDLITATVMRDPAAVKELLDDGKFPNVRQSDGTTPLMIAVGNGDADIAGMLLAKGADPNLRASGGSTALSIARSRGGAGAGLVQLLQRSGAKE